MFLARRLAVGRDPLKMKETSAQGTACKGRGMWMIVYVWYSLVALQQFQRELADPVRQAGDDAGWPRPFSLFFFAQ